MKNHENQIFGGLLLCMFIHTVKVGPKQARKKEVPESHRYRVICSHYFYIFCILSISSLACKTQVIFIVNFSV